MEGFNTEKTTYNPGSYTYNPGSYRTAMKKIFPIYQESIYPTSDIETEFFELFAKEGEEKLWKYFILNRILVIRK